MASNAVTIESPLGSLLKKSFPTALPTTTGNEFTPNELNHAIFPNAEYNEQEKSEIDQWLVTSHHIASESEDSAKQTERLQSLNTHLSTRSTLLGIKPSIADIAIYSRLAPVVTKWSPEERTGPLGYHHIVRHLNFVQNAPLFSLKPDEASKIVVDEDDVRTPVQPIDPKAEKERKKKEKEAAAAAGATAAAATNGTETTIAVGRDKDAAENRSGAQKAKKETKGTGEAIAAAVGAEVSGVEKKGAKKEKQPKQQKAPPPVAPLSPALIDLRVGHILKAENHPNADSLYVSTIACGDPPGTDNTSEYEGKVVRTVCSGLNGLIPLEEMQNRKVITVCNLKPVTMRGIKSAAMVLAASPRVAEGEDSHAGPVELVSPPVGAEAGDRMCFDGWEGEPEGQLNPKKKVWEMCQSGFTTTDDLEVAFDAGAVKELEGKQGLGKLKGKSGVCTVKSLKGATVR